MALGDSATELPAPPVPARLVVTSPPYSAVTDYRADNWLRLWTIRQAPALPTCSSEHKYVNLIKYRNMIQSVFTATARMTDDDTVWLVRCDARQRTLQVVSQALSDVTAGRRLYTRSAPFTRSTQTALYGDSSTQTGSNNAASRHIGMD